MSDLNLLRYYARLEPLGVGEDIKTALPDIAERLFTSHRHARNLLNQMQQLEWLSWAPKVGRHQRSTLVLNLTLTDLKSQLASKRIRQGQYEQALSILDDDQKAFGRLLQSTSGATIREGLLHIQLTYKRSFERIVPHQLQRSSERYLLRQIYCCLVSSDLEGHLKPQLAHHWQCEKNGHQWTFYLRPALTFHNGAAIDADSIVSLFAKLSTLTNYQEELAHLESVISPQPNKVVFEFSKPDLGFGGLVSGVKYAIQPTSQVNNANHYGVIGSGPFEVREHREDRLCLQAFERYYGCRALTDQVTIWKLDEKELTNRQIQTNQPGVQDNNECEYHLSHTDDAQLHSNSHKSRLEDGCMLVLFNQSSPSALDDNQKRYLSRILNPQRVYDQLKLNQTLFGCSKAYNILPAWPPVLRPQEPEADLPRHIDIAVYDYRALIDCALAIKSLLNKLGIETRVSTYSYRKLYEMSQNNQLTETLVVTNINLDDNRHSSTFYNLYTNPVLHTCIGHKAKQWLIHSLEQIRETTPLDRYLDAIEPIASTFIHQYWVTPLFHHRQTLRFHGVLKNVELTNWGWPDIKNVWSTD
ncbi:SgrR family transcriptional regulator [Vibrio sp. OCN044]|uniref:SgrR family transcriptional regulator n=1 Tax=Vibrio tetraodonis subsp. pristinus TaxID=2695891 RepID=A0A6L8M139_9VIBR|nr:SgrR family transcriptional regulator [Vibrio tetraodonis]MYM59222.1 SgrR family transcriptional regulator [Vibrio tetraodonis subsp. pristinus]